MFGQRTRSTSGSRLRRAIGGIAFGGALLLLATGCSAGGSQGTTTSDQAGVHQKKGPAKLVIWTDSVRKSGFEAYQKAHPDVSLDIQVVGNMQDVLTKIQLANRAKKGWPDLVWGRPIIARQLASEPYDFTADISKYIPKKVLEKFAPNAMTVCKEKGRILCLRNDIAPDVLFYNPTLMKKFGYTVPKTWEDFEKIGVKVGKDHPGYSVGAAGYSSAGRVYFQPSRCAVVKVTGTKKLKVGLDSPRCARVAKMLDRLIAAGSMSVNGPAFPEYIKKYGAPGKIVMMYGPIWFGLNMFLNRYGAAPGTYAIAPPMKWAGEKVWNGRVGGGSYFVSRHSHYKKAAADVAKWMATGPYQSDPSIVTFPAYQPKQAGWIKRNVDAGHFSAENGDAAAILKKASATVWTEYGLVNVPNITFGATVTPGLAKGKTVSEMMPQWRKKVTQQAKAAGWQVEK